MWAFINSGWKMHVLPQSLCSHLQLLPLGDLLFLSKPMENLPHAFQLQGSEADLVQDKLTTVISFSVGFSALLYFSLARAGLLGLCSSQRDHSKLFEGV